MIISIDFDGTIVTNEFPKVGEPAPHAIEVIKELQEKGHKIILLTMRDDDHCYDPKTGKCKECSLFSKSCLQDATDYCDNNGIILWGVNKNPTQWKWSASRKVYADIYIDDQACGTPLTLTNSGKPVVDWLRIREIILKDQ